MQKNNEKSSKKKFKKVLHPHTCLPVGYPFWNIKKEDVMLPEYYEFYNPVKILAGKKALENIPFELNLVSAQKPIVITDKGIEKPRH